MKKYLPAMLVLIVVLTLTACGGSKVLTDDDQMKSTLVSVEKVVVDKAFDLSEYVVHMDLENKSSDSVIVQAQNVSMNGAPVDNTVIFHQAVDGNATADGKMTILSSQGELPELKGTLDFTLIIADPATFNIIHEQEVSIDL